MTPPSDARTPELFTGPDDPRIPELANTLRRAARDGDTTTLRTYLELGVPVATTDHVGTSLLALASVHGHEGVVRLLLDHGVAPASRRHRGTLVGGAR